MIEDRSYGILPLRQSSGYWEILLICQRHGGHWGFPKGHSELDEVPQEAALRELHEETGLTVTRWLENPAFIESYRFCQNRVWIQKQVTYFAAIVEGQLVLQVGEVIAAEWVQLDRAITRVTYPQAENILRQLQAAI